jgi:cytochrome c peroxidase
MKIKYFLSLLISVSLIVLSAFKFNKDENSYEKYYENQFKAFSLQVDTLIAVSGTENSEELLKALHKSRMALKKMDFWWRYSNALQYKSINAPLPIEWETEVFEKIEKPYKRVGGGLTLAEIELSETESIQSSIRENIQKIKTAQVHFELDSMRHFFEEPAHLYYCNRLFLLNLASIYSTGFECPDTSRILPELKCMLDAVHELYYSFNQSYPEHAVSQDYLKKYKSMLEFVASQSQNYSTFNHFEFIKDHVNPLYALNAQMILDKSYRTRNLLDYTLNKEAKSIFDKKLYNAQNPKGIFYKVTDTAALNDIAYLGKMLFYDPILSGNNQRSCASCHNPEQYFTDNGVNTAEMFNHEGRLTRNTPSIINSDFNHLIMMDGKHLSLQEQAIAVMCNPEEMGSKKEEILDKVMSIKSYETILKRIAKLTPQEKEPSLEHLVSSLTYYYGKFSQYYSDFDRAMENQLILNEEVQKGFNLFMSKAQCATCHFVPQFNGVKPPYIGSEFEVLGVPADTSFKKLDNDQGRYLVHEADEMKFAFRTGGLKNISKTGPYMHNGIYKTLEEVIEFYNKGGGAGRGLNIVNQTLSSSELGLTQNEVRLLVLFLKSLDEDIQFEAKPEHLAESKKKKYNNRKVGGEY